MYRNVFRNLGAPHQLIQVSVLLHKMDEIQYLALRIKGGSDVEKPK